MAVVQWRELARIGQHSGEADGFRQAQLGRGLVEILLELEYACFCQIALQSVRQDRFPQLPHRCP